MRKVMTVVGTRPELIKLSLVLREMDRHFTHTLVHTGQNYDYELNEIFFKDLQIRKPDFFLNAASTTAIETIAKVLVEGDRLLAEQNPEALLIYGDTNSGLLCLAAKKRRIPIFHMEAGNRCFDQRVPEESNRKIIDHLSDINMTLTEHARRYLLDEGLRPERIIKTGSCMTDVLREFAPQIAQSSILAQLDLKPQSYFLVSAHREENVDHPESLTELIESLQSLVKKYQKRVIFSVHPRTQKKLGNPHTRDATITFMKPLGFFDYIQLQQQACCVLSDSGTLTEESSILGFPAVMIRDAHERPEGSDTGVIMSSRIDRDRILEAVALVIKQQETFSPQQHRIADYEHQGVAETVVRVIASNLDLINREVWKRF